MTAGTDCNSGAVMVPPILLRTAAQRVARTHNRLACRVVTVGRFVCRAAIAHLLAVERPVVAIHVAAEHGPMRFPIAFVTARLVARESAVDCRPADHLEGEVVVPGRVIRFGQLRSSQLARAWANLFAPVCPTVPSTGRLLLAHATRRFNCHKALASRP